MVLYVFHEACTTTRLLDAGEAENLVLLLLPEIYVDVVQEVVLFCHELFDVLLQFIFFQSLFEAMLQRTELFAMALWFLLGINIRLFLFLLGISIRIYPNRSTPKALDVEVL